MSRWFSVIWENRDLEALDSFLAPSISPESIKLGTLAPRRDIPLLVELFHELVGPCKVDIRHFMEDGDWVCVNYIVTAPGADGATPIEVGAMIMVRFEQELIAELTIRFDAICLFEQLGQLPPDTLAACFTGQSLTWK